MIYKYVGIIAFSAQMLAALEPEGRAAYEDMVREYRKRIAAIDTILNKIPLKNAKIKEAHADMLRAFRMIRSEIDTLAQRMHAADSAATIQKIFGPGAGDPVQLGPLRAARSRLVAEVSAIKLVQQQLLKDYNKRFAFHKDILKLLIDDIGNGLINVANELVNKIDALIAQIERG